MARDKRSHKDVVQDATRIAKEIKNKQFKPIYIFCGEEPYYIDLLTKLIAEGVLDVSERDFNQSVVYASDTKAEEVASLARQYPVMAPYQVLIVKEAQQWKNLDGLLPIVQRPVETSIVVINLKGKNIDKRSVLYKLAVKVGEVFQSDKLADWDVEGWIHSYCKEQGIRIEDRAVAQLRDNIGNHIGNLMNALEKLEVVCKDQGLITETAVFENIGISKDFNVFELNKAIGMRQYQKALFIANYFANNEKQHNIIPTLSNVYSYFRKIALYHEYRDKSDRQGLARVLGISPYFVVEYKDAGARFPMQSVTAAFEILHDIDLKSKGVGNASASGGELMKEMVARLVRI